MVAEIDMNLEIDGLDDLIDYLEDMDKNVDKVKEKALIAGGDYLLEKFRSGVYAHGLHRRTGNAERSLDRTDPKNNTLFVGIKGGAKVPGYYLYMQEFGFWNVRARRFIPPKPTFGTIYANETNNILDEYAKVFRQELKLT